MLKLLQAFTARSIAGLIDGVGLLTKSGIHYLAEVFKDFENREVCSIESDRLRT